MDIENEIATWKSSGSFYKIKEGNIWYIDYNSKAKDVICILHGYPTCSYDYKDLITYFPNHRIVIHDHLGFGLSDKPTDYEYLLVDQAKIALSLYSYLGLKMINLFAHDYGTSIATEILARDNEGAFSININKLILSNGSMLIDMSKLRPIQKMLKNKFLGPIVSRFATERTFINNMKNIWFDSSAINVNDMKVLWQLLIMNEGRSVLPKITRYIDQRYENYNRWIGALKNSKKQTLILWAADDPVAIVKMADVLSQYLKNSTKVIIPNSGHYPMIESPKIYAKEIIKYLE